MNFKVGDIVTCIKGGSLTLAGEHYRIIKSDRFLTLSGKRIDATH